MFPETFAGLHAVALYSRITLTLLGESSTLLSEPTALALSCLAARQRHTCSILDPSRALCVLQVVSFVPSRSLSLRPRSYFESLSTSGPSPSNSGYAKASSRGGDEGKIGQRLGCGQWGGVTWGCLTCSGHGGRRGGVRRDVSGQVLDPSRGRGMTRGGRRAGGVLLPTPKEKAAIVADVDWQHQPRFFIQGGGGSGWG